MACNTYSTDDLLNPVPICKNDTTAVEFLHCDNNSSYAPSRIKTPSVITTIAKNNFMS